MARVEEISRRHCFCVFRLFLFVCALWNNDSRCPSGGRRPSGTHVLHQRSGRVQEPSNQDSLEGRQPHAGVSCCRRHCRRLGCESASDRLPDSRQDQGVQCVPRAGQEARGPGRGGHCQGCRAEVDFRWGGCGRREAAPGTAVGGGAGSSSRAIAKSGGASATDPRFDERVTALILRRTRNQNDDGPMSGVGPYIPDDVLRL